MARDDGRTSVRQVAQTLACAESAPHSIGEYLKKGGHPAVALAPRGGRVAGLGREASSWPHLWVRFHRDNRTEHQASLRARKLQVKTWPELRAAGHEDFAS